MYSRSELEEHIKTWKKALVLATNDNNAVLIKFYTKKLIESQNDLVEVKNRTKGPKTDFTVEFVNPHRIFATGAPKQKYIESIHEFGIENIKKYIPDFFHSQERKKGDERFGPNTYLNLIKSNDTMIASLKKVAKAVGREIITTKIE